MRLTLSAPALFSAKCKSFNAGEIYQETFFLEKTLNFFFIYEWKKLKNLVRNEIFRQMSLTLPLDVPVRPMDVKGLIAFLNQAG